MSLHAGKKNLTCRNPDLVCRSVFLRIFALAGGTSMHFKWKTAFPEFESCLKGLIYFEDVDAGGWPVLLKKRI
jgi:hypothetical protein